jgi:hypothetical protein
MKRGSEIGEANALVFTSLSIFLSYCRFLYIDFPCQLLGGLINQLIILTKNELIATPMNLWMKNLHPSQCDLLL